MQIIVCHLSGLVVVRISAHYLQLYDMLIVMEVTNAIPEYLAAGFVH